LEISVPPASTGLELLVFGSLQVRRGGSPQALDLGGRKPKQVLGILASARGGQVSKDRLIDLLWEDRPPRHPVAALENHVWVLRRHLDQGSLTPASSVVVRASGSYRLATERVRLDLDRFDGLVAAAERCGPQRCRPHLEAALALVRGEVFEDEPFAGWAVPLRETYRGRLQGVRLRAAEAAAAEGAAGEVVAHAGQVLEWEPWNERACRLLMEGLARLGERGRAVRAYEACRAALATELHLDPLPETTAVYELVRSGVLSADAASSGFPGWAAAGRGG
jgi:SARP family transcriptional regulator, regulator of embCAB operon